MSMALVAPVGSLAATNNSAASTDLTTRLSASIAAVSPADGPDPAAVSAFLARAELTAAGTTTAPSPAPSAEPENTSSLSMGLPDPAPDYTNLLHARGVSAPSSGDAGGAIADPDPVVQLSPKFLATYVDRGILFFREKKDEPAFPDLSPAKRAEKPAHPKSLLAAATRIHPDVLPKVVPLPQPRTAPRFFSRQPSYASTAFQ
jgi:hypothetical protein